MSPYESDLTYVSPTPPTSDYSTPNLNVKRGVREENKHGVILVAREGLGWRKAPVKVSGLSPHFRPIAKKKNMAYVYQLDLGLKRNEP